MRKYDSLEQPSPKIVVPNVHKVIRDTMEYLLLCNWVYCWSRISNACFFTFWEVIKDDRAVRYDTKRESSGIS